MSTVVDAMFEDGIFKPEQPVDLKEKSKVHLVIETAAPPAQDGPTGWKTAMQIMGCIEDGPEDGAENHDRYIYGYDEEKVIFVDTGFLVALFNRRDRDHPRAREVFGTFQSKNLPELLLTTSSSRPSPSS